MNCPDCNEPLRLDAFGLCPKCDAETFATQGVGEIVALLGANADANVSAWKLCGRCGGAGVVETASLEVDQQTALCFCSDGYAREAVLGTPSSGGYIVGKQAPSSDLERRMVAVLGAAKGPVPHDEFVAKLEMVIPKNWTPTQWNEALDTTSKRDVIVRIK